MKNDKDILAEALARLKSEGSGAQPPKAVVDETLRRLADARPGTGAAASGAGHTSSRRLRFRTMTMRLSVAAAALIALGYAVGRLSGPAPLNMDELREALAPSVAASIEPAIRARLVEDMHQRYQVALAAAYLKVKEELTEQYRDDLNRFAVQFLAASNATTNRLLAEFVENIDTMQAQDLDQVARILRRIELDRVQDKAQLAAGLQRVATRTEQTRQFVQLLANSQQPEDLGPEPRPLQNPGERTQP